MVVPATRFVVEFDAASAPCEPAELTVDVPVEIGGLAIIGDIGAPHWQSMGAAIVLAAQLVDVDDYEGRRWTASSSSTLPRAERRSGAGGRTGTVRRCR